MVGGGAIVFVTCLTQTHVLFVWFVMGDHEFVASVPLCDIDLVGFESTNVLTKDLSNFMCGRTRLN